MRKLLITVALVLFSATAVAQAQEAVPTPSAPAEQGVDAWRYLAMGAGAVAGIWAANVVSAGLVMPAIAGAGAGAPGLVMVTRAVLVIGGAVAGSYVGAWLYDD